MSQDDGDGKQGHCVSRAAVDRAFLVVNTQGVRQTPTLQGSETLVPFPQVKLFFKCEAFQRTGSFKFRGATNAVNSIIENQSKANDPVIVTVSSGNFAQGAALAAKLAGLRAKIVMPENTTAIKVNAVRSYGAEVEFCHPNRRDEHCAQVVKDLGARARFIHPSEDPDVIAGNGTLMLEFIQQVKMDHNQKLDVVVCPVGGGGVISGVSAVATSENILVVGAEPSLADDAYRSKLLGSVQPHRVQGQTPQTIAEGLRTTLGPNTFPCIRDWVHEIILVSDQEIAQAMKLIWERLKVVAEASSCVAYAAVKRPEFEKLLRERFPGRKQINVGIILTGGNVDFTDYFRSKV